MADFSTTPDWPPNYTLRRSPKAKQVFLQFNRKRLLEIVIPEKRKQINVEELLNQKRKWIEKHLRPLPHVTRQLPTTLLLQAISQQWELQYKMANSQRVLLKENTSDNILTLSGNIDNIELCHQKMVSWLVLQAKKHFIPWMFHLSFLHHLMVKTVTVRKQSTLWGSCSADKTIRLNYKLLFFPKTLAEHVLLHELCHTKHLNHSNRFWSLLSKLDPNSLAHKKQLRKAEDFFVPHWLSEA